MERVYFYDFSKAFKNGAICKVRILYWYTVEGNPKAVVEVIDTPLFKNPQEGEILKVNVGPEFFSRDEDDAQDLMEGLNFDAYEEHIESGQMERPTHGKHSAEAIARR